MATQSLIYSNARVKTMENTMLSSEKITRMIHSASLSDAIKILYESNYGGGVMVDNPYEYENILVAEEDRVTSFMREAMPKDSGLDSFLVKLDYHNAKALVKSKFLGLKNSDFMLAPSGNIDLDILKTNVESENFSAMPKYMSEAIKNIVNNFNINPINPRYIDNILDKAMFADILNGIKSIKAKSIKKYWTAYIDLTNISTVIRCIRIKADNSLFKDSFIEGGEIKIDIFIKALENGYDSLTESLAYTEYKNLTITGAEEAKSGNPLTTFEVEYDNFLMEIFKQDKADIFSVAPLAGFYIAKKIEIKTVRMILVCLKCGVDLSQIKMRLRGFYA